VVASLSLALILGWFRLRDPTQFPVRIVKVQAAYQHVNREILQQVILPYVNGGFFNMNTAKLEQQLKQVPWVADAGVQRVWPDKVVINITEHKPVARYGDHQLINEKGQIFTPPAAEMVENLPFLNGSPEQTQQLWQDYQELNAAIAPLKLSIQSLTIDDRQTLSLVLNNGTKVLLGQTQALPRMQRFVKVYHKIFTSPEMQAISIDLRYENGLTVKWPDKTTSPVKSTATE
jgi:cell division protein FtsQ